MHNSLTLVQKTMQELVETLSNAGVVCTTAADGELLLEPDEHDLAARLSQLRFMPTRTADLGMYLVYIPLPDVLAHLLPASTLPQAQALRQGLATATALHRGDLP
jgi:hypothetical protein